MGIFGCKFEFYLPVDRNIEKVKTEAVRQNTKQPSTFESALQMVQFPSEGIRFLTVF